MNFNSTKLYVITLMKPGLINMFISDNGILNDTS